MSENSNNKERISEKLSSEKANTKKKGILPVIIGIAVVIIVIVVQLINVNRKWKIFFFKKGRTSPLVKILFFKMLIGLIYSILCSYVVFSSIVLFDMFLRSNNLKWFIIYEYCKYYVAYFMWNSTHCYKLWLWIAFLEIVFTKDWIFSFSITWDTDAL